MYLPHSFQHKADAYITTRNPSRKSYLVLIVDGVEVLKSEDTIPDRYIATYRWDLIAGIMLKLEKQYVIEHGDISHHFVDFKFEPVPFVYEHSITEEGVVMPTNEQIPVNDLTSQDVVKFGKEVGRGTIKQTLVWTLAAFATKAIRSALESFTKPKAK